MISITASSSALVVPFEPKPRPERFVRLPHSLLDSTAWQLLHPIPQALYLKIARKFNGRNNGRIPYSVREAERALYIGRATAHRAFRALEHLDLIVCCRRGSFSLKTREAKSSEWLLPHLVPLQNPAGSATEPNSVPLQNRIVDKDIDSRCRWTPEGREGERKESKKRERAALEALAAKMSGKGARP